MIMVSPDQGSEPDPRGGARDSGPGPAGGLPSRTSIWIRAMRPRTLAAGVVPVLVGSALAATVQRVQTVPLVACLATSVLIQIGTNFANDALDAGRGADGPDRLGPVRAVASGLVDRRTMLLASCSVLALALGIGLYLASLGGWPILVLGLLSLACAICYTGGPFPLAYHGLGDAFVFLFFGLVAVLGSAWVQVAQGMASLPRWWWPVAAAVGLQATTIIAVNNIRDRESDQRCGKHTLEVRLGDRASRAYYILLHVLAVLCLGLGAWLRPEGGGRLLIPAAVAAAAAIPLARGVWMVQGRGLNRYLARSAAAELITGVCLVVSLSI